MKLSKENAKELLNLCRLLVEEAVVWETDAYGNLSPSVYVYGIDEQGSYITVSPLVDDVAFLIERIRDILSDKPEEISYEN